MKGINAIISQCRQIAPLVKTGSKLPFVHAYRYLTQTPSGALLQKPQKMSLGLTKFFVIVTPCIYVGGKISMTGASLLEDYDIFVPDDEDD